jgi:hypothetical protein
MVILLAIVKNNASKEWQARQERNELQQRFQQETDRAIRATADPCATVFYELVTPAAEINDSPKLVMMGNVVSSVNSPLDPSTYQLRLNGNHIELWTNFIAAQRYGEASRSWTKIGEKIWPSNNPLCKK